MLRDEQSREQWQSSAGNRNCFSIEGSRYSNTKKAIKKGRNNKSGQNAVDYTLEILLLDLIPMVNEIILELERLHHDDGAAIRSERADTR